MTPATPAWESVSLILGVFGAAPQFGDPLDKISALREIRLFNSGTHLDLLYANDTPGRYPDSYYVATANRHQALRQLDQDIDCDVCVVGAGYTGLSAALHCAEQGLDTVVVDGAPHWLGCIRPQWRPAWIRSEGRSGRP